MFRLKTNQETLHTIDVFINDFKISSINTHISTYMIDDPVFHVIYSRCFFSSNSTISQTAQSEGDVYYDKQTFLDFLSNHYPCFNFLMPNDDLYYTLKPQFEDFDLNQFVCPVLNFKTFISDVDFDTNLYPELINNHETKSMLETWVNDGDISGWTSDDKQIMQMIEDYNHNVLQLRATKKVNASVSGSISQSGQSQTVDLTATNNALNNIANKLKRTETIDNQEVEKNITQTINELNLSNQTVITTVEKAPYNPLLDDGSDIDF